jgi:hypothetical protein
MVGVAPEDDDGEAAQGQRGREAERSNDRGESPRAERTSNQLSISAQLAAAKTRDDMMRVRERAQQELDPEDGERFEAAWNKKMDQLRAAARGKLHGNGNGNAPPADASAENDGRA